MRLRYSTTRRMTFSAVSITRKIWPLVSQRDHRTRRCINVFDKVRVEHNGRVIQSRKPDQEASSGNIGGFDEFVTATGAARQVTSKSAASDPQEGGKGVALLRRDRQSANGCRSW